MPTARQVNIAIGTQRGLILTSRGMGGVYRPDAMPLSTGWVPFGVTRPPFGDLRSAPFAMRRG
jgi:hypothetical protein